MDTRAQSQNAADPRQVRRARRLAKHREERFITALRAVLETPAGRLVFGEREQGLLARLGAFRSAFHQSGSVTYYQIGRQDAGHELIALLVEASEDLYLEMEREMRALAKRDEETTAAAQSPDRDD
jgi:hypothetical protein